MASQLDIAKATGFNQSIVSRVLAGRARECNIADKTAQQILAVAKQMNYTPNRAANIVFGRPTGLIGVAVGNFSDPFLNVLLEEINLIAVEANLSIIVTGLSSEEVKAKKAASALEGYRPDALIVIGGFAIKNLFRQTIKANKKIVQIGVESRTPGAIGCRADEAQGARLIATHLHELGHTRLAFAANASNSLTSQVRLAALRQALHKKQSLPQGRVFSPDMPQVNGAKSEVEKIVRALRAKQFSALVCMNDMIAIGLMHSLSAQGIRIPDDLSLISYDDLPIAACLQPALTTLHLPIRQMATTAMQMITGAIPAASVELECELRVRESTAPLRKPQG